VTSQLSSPDNPGAASELMDDLKRQTDSSFHEAIELVIGSHWAYSLSLACISARFAGGELVFEQESPAPGVTFTVADMVAIFKFVAENCE
jgi:hypothetical protein